MKKHKIILMGLILLLITGCGKVKIEDGKQLVFKHNDLKLSADAFYERLKKESGGQVLFQMISESILNKEYPTTKEMEKEINSIINSYKEQYGENYLDTLNSYSGTNFNSEKELFEFFETNKKTEKLLEDYAGSIITEEELLKYYENTEIGKMRASHILIAPDVKDGMKEDEIKQAEKEAKELAVDIIKKLDSGESFKELAIEYSEDSGSASNGGDVGYFEHGKMVSEFEEATIKLNVDEYSKTPVKTRFGYHIILKTDQLEKESFDNVKEKITNIIINEKLETITNIYGLALEQITIKYNLEIYDSQLKEIYNNYLTNLKNR